MMKGYLYLATDGVGDFKKFGIASNPNIRLINYNTTEHLRPIYFEKVFGFKSYSDARDAETQLRRELKQYIIQTHHIETFVCNEITENIFNESTKEYVVIDFTNDYAGNIQNKRFPYYKELLKLINFALDVGMCKIVLERLIIKHKVGYYRENAPPRVIMEDRIKHLIQLGNKELCWDNKPRMLDRMQKFYCLEEEIKSLLVNLQ
jgi:hypothetical protein